MTLVKKIVKFTDRQQKITFLTQIQNFQNSLSKYAITKDQHLGFEAAA
jgi:hypothetical protein